ncbi:PAS domain S-box protein [Rhodoblastus acidophilus]|uniref:histidine kinase n=1 Tax=Candidatus Rhodoblastus alkanivorans TaxID=2954117 RepID=A0ABS9Z844_9HYPH|nr:ATP-binding protein [Candidatus Rhodoblastus alkanivorans]MCI4678993.1 PAS domain S-box protein [Candidatus Rhodoblastus alkanivorans]MCI4683771.1 PAS domain S-box protein [Candidatus Rhodoblastus alkanivorans]MDI4641089.1 PAS domain S-box protein [Rhodoblastus acidophilus]
MKQARDENEMLRRAFEACPAGMLLVDGDGRIELANEECERMFGYEHGALAGRRVEELMPAKVRDAHRGHRAGFSAAAEKRQMGMGRDLVALRRDGSEFFIEVGLTPIETAVGSRVVAFAIDITARRDSEYALRRAMHELEMANENLARFAYVASHDIQEPLRKISAFADILRAAMAQEDRDEACYAADVMASSALHARRLVADLLTYARAANQSYAIEPISITAALERALDNLSQSVAEEKAEIVWEGEDFSVEADRLQLHQMLQNILSNALKYHKLNEPPHVTIQRAATGSEGRLAIVDRGIGFSATDADQIFEPFRRLHGRAEYPGTGIGLAICKTVAKRHGWRLSATSTPTVGATFDIVFPIDADIGKGAEL